VADGSGKVGEAEVLEGAKTWHRFSWTFGECCPCLR